MPRPSSNPNERDSSSAKSFRQSPQSSHQLVEHFFRHESANLIAVLVRAFGVSRIELIEDMVQQAMLEAMKTWQHRGLPDQPSAWIYTVTKRRILDSLKREETHQRALAFSGQSQEATELLVDRWLEEEHLPDSLLRMMFVCCHPQLDRLSQISLTLKILCGFGIEEIARGLLSSKESIKKRVQRARTQLQELKPSLDLPKPSTLGDRLSTVHEVLYLLFNEGYSTSKGHDPIRDDLCEEAARLCHLICESDFATRETYTLLALMLFHASRLKSRVDKSGAIILLEDQDRSLWNRSMIKIAEGWLIRSAPPGDDHRQLTPYHLEAVIARHHCIAPSLEETDWGSIVKIYDRLLERFESPIYKLNRAIAKGQLGESEIALEELEALSEVPKMKDYFLLDCAKARIYELSKANEEALLCYHNALKKKVAQHERELVERKMQKIRKLMGD